MSINRTDFLRLYFGGVHGDRYSSVEDVLDGFLRFETLPRLDPQPFMFEMYRRWVTVGRLAGLRDRTVKPFSVRMANEHGINSAYARLTGRLKFDQFVCVVFLKTFLLEWLPGKPYGSFDEEKVIEFTMHLFPAPFLRVSKESAPLSETDLEFLLEVARLGIPVTLKDLDKILRMKDVLTQKTA